MTPLEVLARSPREVVLDLVLPWSESIGKVGAAKVVDGKTLIFMALNHRRECVHMVVPVHFDGTPVLGNNPRFVMTKLGPGVWKLAPSVSHDQLHAYITIIEVPEPAPWV